MCILMFGIDKKDAATKKWTYKLGQVTQCLYCYLVKGELNPENNMA